MIFARFRGLPTLLWTIICPHFRVLGLDFLMFSKLRFHIWGRNPVFQKGDQNGTPKGGTLWSARLFYVASLFFARFLGLPSLLWTIICPHFRALGLDFLVFSRLRFQDFGANETHPIHTHKPTIFIFHKGCPLRAGGDARSVRNLTFCFEARQAINAKTPARQTWYHLE